MQPGGPNGVEGQNNNIPAEPIPSKSLTIVASRVIIDVQQPTVAAPEGQNNTNTLSYMVVATVPPAPWTNEVQPKQEPPAYLETHIGLSMLSFLSVPTLPLGWIAIWKSVKAKTAIQQGDYQRAAGDAKCSLIFSIPIIIFQTILNIIHLVLIVKEALHDKNTTEAATTNTTMETLVTTTVANLTAAVPT